MPHYNILIEMPGGKELKFEKGQPPITFPGVGNINIPADTKPIVAPNPFVLDDELHAILHKPKAYTTYLLCKTYLHDGIAPDGQEAFEDALSLIDLANYYEVVESVFSYQILKLEFYDLE